MKEILFSVLTVCLFSSAVTYLCPDGRGSLLRMIRAVCSVCVCAALISPAVELMGKAPRVELVLPESEQGTKGGNAVAEAVCQRIEEELEERLTRDFGIIAPSLSLSVDSSDVSALKIIGGELAGKGARLNEGAEYVSILLDCGISVKEIP
jgi:hypothetical protein